MTATYLEERSDQTNRLDLIITGKIDRDIAERETREMAHRERRCREHLQALWTVFEAESALLQQGSLAALDQIDWIEIDELSAAAPIEFAHPWEGEFARMLAEQEISWQYKPRTFAVEWDEEGNFVDCFTPDFYLPSPGVYVEVIARDPGMSNAKARKVRLLRQLHPEIRILLLECPEA